MSDLSDLAIWQLRKNTNIHGSVGKEYHAAFFKTTNFKGILFQFYFQNKAINKINK